MNVKYIYKLICIKVSIHGEVKENGSSKEG